MRIIQRIAAVLTVICVYIDSGYAQRNNVCGLEKFQCRNGECIAGELLCDGTAHCRDSSDETVTECTKPEILCPTYAFRCNYGACINGDSVCNGIQDCVDNSDETQPQCRRSTSNPTATPTQSRSCKPNQFSCDNGQCIDAVDVCDGTPNCADGSDEVSTRCKSLPCPATAFRCAYGACIDGDLQCNGINNCVDGSDESRSLCSEWREPPTRTTTRTTIRPTTRPISTQQTTQRTRPTPSSRRTCRAPPQPENGHWQLHRSQCSTGEDCDVPEGTELELGSHLIYSCNSGYKLNGSSDVSCSIEGRWLNVPVCSEIRCKPLTTASTEATCTYNDEWVSCESPVLPKTKASLSCRNSYRRESTLLSRSEVRCNANGQWEPQPTRCVPVCGTLPANVVPLIVNGQTPNITEFPWHATMYREQSDKSKKYFCGATIIQENLLITAAHCVYDDPGKRLIDANKIYIATGNIFRDYDSPFHDRRLVKKNKVKKIHIICNYIGLTGNYAWDIAILELVEPFVLSTWLVPACLDPNNDQTILEPGVYGKVAGFGRTAIGESSAVLQSLRVPYVSYSQCESASQNTDTGQFITIDKFCAGYLNGSSVCDGDSGGGFVVKTNGLWYLRGIVSVSLGTIYKDGAPRCDNNLYSLYTRISSHIEWVQDVITRLEQNRPYPSCPNKS